MCLYDFKVVFLFGEREGRDMNGEIGLFILVRSYNNVEKMFMGYDIDGLFN